LGPCVVFAEHATAFDGKRGIAVMMEAAREPVRRMAQRTLGITLRGGKLGDQVCTELLMHNRRTGCEGLLGIHHRGQRLEIRLDERRGVLGRITALGHDDREGLPHMPYLIAGEQGLLRIEDVVLHGCAPLARQGDLMIGHGRQQPDQLDSSERINNPRCGRSARQINRADASMRHGTTHERRMKHARQNDIIDILSMPEQQPAVLASQHGPADEGLPCKLVQVAALPAPLCIGIASTSMLCLPASRRASPS
jgi:hypothetical protein